MTAPVRTGRAPSSFPNEAGATPGASSEPQRPGSPSAAPPAISRQKSPVIDDSRLTPMFDELLDEVTSNPVGLTTMTGQATLVACLG